MNNTFTYDINARRTSSDMVFAASRKPTKKLDSPEMNHMAPPAFGKSGTKGSQALMRTESKGTNAAATNINSIIA